MGMPFPIRLRWDRHYRELQAAKLDAGLRDVQIDSDTPPEVDGLPAHLTELDYWGSRGRLRVSAEQDREMTREECDSCLRFLDQMAAAARAAFFSKR